MIKKFYQKLVISLATLVLPVISYAQVKINDFSEVEDKVKTGATSFRDIAIYIIGAILAIGLAGVIWELASNKQNAKDHLIIWFVAVGVYLIAIMII